MKKPQMKREVAVTYFNKNDRFITLYSTKDAMDEFKEFGTVLIYYSNPNMYDLTVDKRYDFDEILAYIENYDNNQ